MRRIVAASLALALAGYAHQAMASEWHTVAHDAVGCYEYIGPGDGCIKLHAGDRVFATKPVSPSEAFALVRYHDQPLMIRSQDLDPLVAAR